MLYMLGQRIIDTPSFTPKCLIKVGVTRDLNKRIKNYKSDNPSAVLISTTAGVEQEESKCHIYLAKIGKLYSGEWYEVPNNFYVKCLKKGFADFPIDKKQNIYMHTRYTGPANPKNMYVPVITALEVTYGEE